MTDALATRPDVSQLCMLACYPRADEATAIAPDGGNDASTMHVTLVFLGSPSEIDMNAVRSVAAAVAASTVAMTGSIGGVGLFAASEDGYPQVALPDVKGLATLRTRIVDGLEAEGIHSPSEHDWVPHLTLAYVDDPALADMSVTGKPLSFDSLSVTVGDERTDFPFSGGETFAARLSRSQQRKLELLIKEARSL